MVGIICVNKNCNHIKSDHRETNQWIDKKYVGKIRLDCQWINCDCKMFEAP